MTIPIHLKDLFILVGVGNGIILSTYLIFSKGRVLSRILLGALIFCICYNVSIYIVLKYNVYNQYPSLHWLPFGLTYIIGPLIFFYCKSVISPSFKIRKEHLKHFLLLVLDYPHSIYHLVYGRAIPYQDLHYVLDKFAYFSVITNAFYLYSAYKIIREYNQQLPNYTSNTQNLKLKWLSDTIVLWSCLLSFVLIYGGLDFIIDFDFGPAYFVNAVFTLTILWLGIRGISQNQSNMEIHKVGTQKITDEKSHEIISALNGLMETQRLYLYPDLTLRNVEDQIGFSSKEISLAINQSLGKNFYHFVNEYRVEEFKKRAQDPSYNHLTFFGIAQESGFNSKATFNRVFKEKTGMSPGDFLSQSTKD